MAQIGNLGRLIVFEVSSEKVMTFASFAQTVKGRWAEHNMISGKPKSEYIGSDLRSANMTIVLSAEHGVKPRSTIEAIERAVETGEVFPLVIGGKRVGDYSWRITSMSETWDNVVLDGVLAKAKISIQLDEYV